MSFLTRVQPVLRSSLATTPATRALTTTALRQKTATESVKDTVKGVDRAVSDAAVKGLDKAEQLKNSAAAAAGSNASEAKGKAAEVAGQAKGKAAEAKGEIKGKAAEVKGKM